MFWTLTRDDDIYVRSGAMTEDIRMIRCKSSEFAIVNRFLRCSKTLIYLLRFDQKFGSTKKKTNQRDLHMNINARKPAILYNISLFLQSMTCLFVYSYIWTILLFIFIIIFIISILFLCNCCYCLLFIDPLLTC